MSNENNELHHDDYFHSIYLECPICHSKKMIKLPEMIIKKNKPLTTISIPKGIVCYHPFQTYIDKHFIIRGYEKIDFEFSEIDFFYKEQDSKDGNQINQVESSIIEVVCPRCVKKLKIPYNPDSSSDQNIQEVLIDGKIPNHCGHEFIAYVDKNQKIIGYSNIKNIDVNDDLKDIFQKL